MEFPKFQPLFQDFLALPRTIHAKESHINSHISWYSRPPLFSPHHTTSLSSQTGHLRLISPTHLFNVLKLVLNHVSIHSYLPSSVPLHSTIKALEKEHDSREEILREVLTCWFGKINSETRDGNEDEVKVELNDEEIVKFLGNRVLEAKKVSNREI